MDFAHSEQAERTRLRAGDNRPQTACRGFPSLWLLAFQFLGTELVPSAGVNSRTRGSGRLADLICPRTAGIRAAAGPAH
jgi:hypothetical protein